MGNGDRVAFGQGGPLDNITGEDLTFARLLEYDLQQSPAFLSQKQAIDELQNDVKTLDKEVATIRAFREGEDSSSQKWRSTIRTWVLFGGVVASVIISVAIRFWP